MEIYDAMFPYLVMLICSVSSVSLVIGGAYTGYAWAVAPITNNNDSRASNLYAGVWVFAGSCLAAMAILWITKKILTY